MFRGGWTRYRDKEYGARRFGTHVRAKRTIRSTPSTDNFYDVYAEVQSELRNVVPKARGRWRSYQDVSYLGAMIHAAEHEAGTTKQLRTWLRALVLQTPHAAQAQRQMDAHPHGFKNKQVRTLELIDFNDAFVACVLLLPKDDRATFAEEARRLMDWFCKRVGVKGFSNEQYEAIVRGLSREVAVYHGAIAQGLQARLTGRHADAMGIDVVVSDPEKNVSINIDCKTPSSYRHRLKDLLFEGRISEDELNQAIEDGYCIETNGHGGEQVHVVLLCIDADLFGEVVNFEFSHVDTLGEALRFLLERFGI